MTGAPRVQLSFLAGSFAVATLIARAAGSEWGEAATFGQLAFAAVLVTLLLRAD
jgi:hypothetical protein